MNQLDYQDNQDNPFGQSIPLDVKFASKLLLALSSSDENDENHYFGLINESNLDCLLKMCYNYCTNNKSFSRYKYLRVRKSILNEWQTNESLQQLNLSEQDFDSIFAGLLSVCQCISRNFTKPNCLKNIDNLRDSIIKYSQMPEPIVNLIYKQFMINNDNDELKPNIIPFVRWDSLATGNRLISIRWQLHLAISDRFATKIMEPFVRFEFIYGSDCKQKRIVFECRIKQFHQLRFIVALLLKEMSRLKMSNKILTNNK